VLEAFPVGRRLAYDAERGRLWVVCPACERWNLTPLDARWEAIEQAERLFGGTRLRVATDNVGLARVADGTDLVRVGRPLRRRWRLALRRPVRPPPPDRLIGIGAGLATAGGAVLLLPAGFVAGVLAGLAVPAALLASVAARRGWVAGRTSATAGSPTGAGSHVLISRNELPMVRLAPGGAGGWQLRFPYLRRAETTAPRLGDVLKMPEAREVTLDGAAAAEAARALLPLANGSGARATQVRDAVDTLEELGARGGVRAGGGPRARVGRPADVRRHRCAALPPGRGAARPRDGSARGAGTTRAGGELSELERRGATPKRSRRSPTISRSRRRCAEGWPT
jgi:hypothetical protein